MGEPKPKHDMLLRQHSPPSLVEGEWESVPPIQFMKVEGRNLTTKNVLSHELTKKGVLSSVMALLPLA